MPDSESPRRKRIRLEDVARSVNISMGTASMAVRGSARISPETRQRVRDACKTLGYKPPRSAGPRPAAPRRAATRVGLALVNNATDSVINVELLHGLSSTAHARRFRLEVQSFDLPRDDGREFRQRFEAFAAPCDGLLLSGTLTCSMIHDIDAMHPRVACLGWPVLDDAYVQRHGLVRPGVVIAGHDQSMGRYAANRLIAAGHRRIAFLAEVMPPGSSHAKWREGYALALADAGIDVDPSLIHVTGIGADLVAAKTRKLAALRKPPTAYVVADLCVAAAMLAELDALGRAPAEDALVIWGNPRLARLNGIPGRPMLGIDHDKWIEAALAHLQAGERALPRHTEVLVPFVKYNMG